MKTIIIFLLCGICKGTEDALGRQMFRLPNQAKAISYDIKIQPNITNNTFYGEVNIYVEIQSNQKILALNMKNITIKSLAFDNSEDLINYVVLDKYEMLVIRYKDTTYIQPGEHLIHAKYTGDIGSDSTGLFKGTVESGGKTFVSLATMFSAPYARTVFPCFDEPSHKSKFNIRLVTPNKTFTALSNMEEINSFEIENGIAVDFKTTPTISPYLVCFVFTEYNYKSSEYTNIDGRVVPIRFFMLDEYLDQAPFLLEVAKNALQFFENYTNLTYPDSKLDFIEIPGFVDDGMENLGLVILSHNSVSFNASCDKPKVELLMDAALLIVHEISHMWFGDIVTPMWYNDLWLAEGFAQLMEIKGLQNQYSVWQLEGMDHIFRRDIVMHADNAPIINFPMNNQQVDLQFNDITYVKGSAVLGMLEIVMGQRKFQLGIRKFLNDFFMGSATTGQFINIMQSFEPSTNLRGFLETWLHQDRFPLLTISWEKSSKSYILRQRSFMMTPKNGSIFGRKWTIPVIFQSSCNKSFSINWFDMDADILRIPSCGENWIKFNHKAMSYYRVLYTEKQYEQLLINFDKLDEADQAHLILESSHLVAQKLIPCEIPLKFVGKLKGEYGLLPSIAAFNVLHRNMEVWVNFPGIQSKLRRFFIDTFRELYEKLNWRISPMDDPVVRLLRAKLMHSICLGHIAYEKCIEDAEKVKREDGNIHGDLLHVWRKLMRKKNNQNVDANVEMEIVDLDGQLFHEQCSKWIKLNL